MTADRPLSNGTADAPQFDSIEDTITAFKNGHFIIVLDSPLRENEGDLIISARHLTTSKCAFLIHHTSGYLCAAMPAARADALGLPLMVKDNRDPNRTQYTISVDADHERVSTGISARDRALTCRLLGGGSADDEDGTVGAEGTIDIDALSFRRPGHVLPLVARDGGVRQRRGHTEAAVEFCRLADVGDVGIICELVDSGEEVPGRSERTGGDGMLRRDGCLAFAKRWGLRCCTIEALVEYLDRGEGVNGVHEVHEVNGVR
ncbi:MAG: hypothetical protein M1817_005859 [Caeruleum heppii]|nr:MAG: hypothetical protein M1817_005859 [Caeruleum heppii]